jgi:hypothetical protein
LLEEHRRATIAYFGSESKLQVAGYAHELEKLGALKTLMETASVIRGETRAAMTEHNSLMHGESPALL